MINKLKRKFIGLATVSILVLMTVLVGIMNIINYSVVVKEIDSTIEVLSHNPFPDKDNPPDKNDQIGGDTTDSGSLNDGSLDGVSDSGSLDSAAQDENSSDAPSSDNTPPDKPQNSGENFMPSGMSPEVPYESRFFTVTISSDGNIIKSDFSKILSVDENTANKYIKIALKSKNSKGFAKQFRYLKKSDGRQTDIIFLDCGRKLDSYNAFLWTSIIVGFGGCVIVFVVFLLISGKIVKPIAESYAKQKRFISDAGHEIKTPLTIINANLDLLESDEKSEELDEIRKQTKRMTQLTNNLVYLSKMEESEHTVKKIEMPLSDIVLETANSFKSLSLTKELNFTADITPNISIIGAPDAIRQLTSVLLENAIKYSEKRGTVQIKLTLNKKSAVLTVFNTTETQINKDDLPYVFDRFYRADASRNSSTGGYGIGLSVAKAVIEAHGGNIKAETESGKDFLVTAILPLKA